MSNWDKDIEDIFENLLRSLCYGIKSFCVGAFHGAKKLKQRKFLIGFFISMLIPIVWVVKKTDFLIIESKGWRYFIYYVGLIAPLLYLKIISGIGVDRKLGAKLIQAGIVCQDGKPPSLLSKELDKKGYEVLRFKGSYKIDSWRKKAGDIETALNITILEIEQGSRKDIVEITTVPAKCKMQKKLDWDDKYLSSEDGVVSLGNNGVEDIMLDFNKDPHIIVAGATGSGKSVMLRAILWQFIKQGHKPIMADFKNGLEFGKQYRQFGETITEKDRLLVVLETLKRENDIRQTLFEKNDVKNIIEYNKKFKNRICRVIVVIDEVAEILDKLGLEGEDKELILQIEKNMSSLARVSRSAGIHFMLGIQRPDAKVLTGQIKTNCTGRICGRVSDGAASEIVLDNTLAAKLKKIPGRMLFQNGGDTIEFQSYYFDDDRDLKSVDVEMGTLLTEDTNFNCETLEFNSVDAQVRAVGKAKVIDKVKPTIKSKLKEKFKLKGLFKLKEKLNPNTEQKSKVKTKEQLQKESNEDLLDLETLDIDTIENKSNEVMARECEENEIKASKIDGTSPDMTYKKWRAKEN